MNNIIGQAWYISLWGMGIKIDDIKEDDVNFTLYVTVPSSSDDRDTDGKMMAGDHLAKVVQTRFPFMTGKKLLIRYKIRNEHWTAAKRRDAELMAKRIIFGG